MTKTITCIKLGSDQEAMDFPPFPGALGERIFQNVSKKAWQAWLEQQKMLLNENRLNLADPEARKYLKEQTENYFFGDGADSAQGFVPVD
jgi:Fe-S cluster biosynthesis and repair protein YggX